LRICFWERFPPLLGVEDAGQSRRGLGGLEDSQESVMGESGEPKGDEAVWQAFDSIDTTVTGSKL
jgi:hypothetical protein